MARGFSTNNKFKDFLKVAQETDQVSETLDEAPEIVDFEVNFDKTNTNLESGLEMEDLEIKKAVQIS